MFCLQCGAANANDASTCSQCNQAIAPVSRLPDTPPGSALPQPQQYMPVYEPPPARPKSVVTSLVCVAGGLLIVLLMAWAHAPRSLLNEILWPEGVGFAGAAFLLSATVSFLGFGRKKNWHGFARCFAAVMGLSLVMTASSSSYHAYDLNKSIVTLVRQASGAEPPTDRTPAEKAVRELLVEVFAKRNAYQAKAKSFRESPEAQTMLRPTSYRSIKSIEATKQQLTFMIDADNEMKQYVETGMMQTAQQTVQHLPWAESEKQGFLEGMHKSFDPTVYSNSFIGEMKWLTASRDLYDLAEAHFSSLRVNGDSVTITNEAFRQEFNAHIQQVNQLRVEMRNAATAAESKANTVRSEIGASASDFGIK